jgi:hypothetical protein
MSEDDSTPPTRQPISPREGGSVGPENPAKLPPIPPTEEPDHGIVEVPSVGPGLPPFTPEIPRSA